ncbi:phosphatidate cytidylyltransferase [Pseudolysinimonas sp.]|uniref:phosphatidate cytidylyltransferase n=1 Tax=Pseudolysinimonas sp. TaxID=2680009 RepID=UPI003F80364B
MPTPPEGSPAPKAPHDRHDPRADIEAGLREARAQFDAANEAINRRSGRNLPAAIGIGILLGGAFLVSLIIFKWLFIIFGAVLIGFTAWELTTAIRVAGRMTPRVVSVVVGVLAAPVAFFAAERGLSVEGLWLGTLGAIVIVSLWRLGELAMPSHRTGAKNVLLDIGAGMFVQVYITFMAGFYLVLTASSGPHHDSVGGEYWTLACMIIVVATDTGAWGTGIWLGKHKLAPNISPGKTWEGFAGSIVVAIVAGMILAPLMLHVPIWIGIVMGLLLALVGTAGDLTESLIKRDLGIKDISSILPGHGGFLDRLDSILPSAAVAYAIYYVLGVAGLR